MEEEKAVNEDAQTKDLASKNGDDADDLLQKISEAVKGDSKLTETAEDISKSSEGDFLKKIEEIENENTESSTVLKDTSAGTSSETVVVGKLIIDINADLKTTTNTEKNKNLNVSDIVTKKSETNVPEKAKNSLEEDKNSCVNIDNPMKTNIKKPIEINLKEEVERIEKNKSNLPNNIESMDTSDSFNNVEKMEIGSVEKNDMEIDEPQSSPSRNTDNEISSQVKDNTKLPEISKSEVRDTCIDNAQKETLVKEKGKNLLSLEKEIKLGVILPNSTAVLPTNNDENKKNELIENGETASSVKDDVVHCPEKVIKEDSLLKSESLNYKNSNNKSPDKINVENEATKAEGKKILPQNKIISDLKNEDIKTNLNTTPLSTPTVFNSTPITKQFEISSENVSKISEAETSQTQNSVEGNLEKPKAEESTTETETECGTCTTSESDHKSSDAINKYAEICKNGIRDTTTDEEYENSAKCIKKSETILKMDLPTCSSSLETKLDGSYEVNFNPDENDIRYFSVEKIELKKTNSNILLEKSTSISSDQSSYGSFSSLTPFTLPTKSLSHLSEISSTTSTSGSQKIIVAPVQSPKNITRAFKKKIDLCTFVIDHFTKIKNNIETITSKNINTNVIKKNLIKEESKSSPSVSPSSTDNKTSRKRSINTTRNEDESEDVSKSKQLKKNISVGKNDEVSEYGECVLAKWIDKKYYAGRISGEKPGNKFVVLFEDGASKILSKDAIVFGEGRVLPLKNQSVYALVDEDDYERGIVVSIEKGDDKVYYTVKTDNKTVKITASDIYLQENQAKIIQKAEITSKLTSGQTTEDHQTDKEANNGRLTRNKRPLASPVTPEAGFSGSAKGNKRQKRHQITAKIIPEQNRYDSTSEDSDIPEESSISQSSFLEAIEGVQPEVQKTDSESEISKMIFLSDIQSLNPDIVVDDILGPLPIVKNIFKNKYFILSCTVGLKPHQYENTIMFGENYRNRQFSNIPFVKVNLKKQLEAGGGKVFEHFEDIPKTKYRQCKLIASRPCLTAKYIQCLAADIHACSHEWIINCCKENRLLNYKEYALPAGWSITKQIFIKWNLGKSTGKRESKDPFSKVCILLAAHRKDFAEYWNRVCKMAGAEVRSILSLSNITPSTKGYLVADMDFPQVIRTQAEHFGIQIVSTVWIVESLILGKLCPANSNRKLIETFQDDDL